MLPALLLAASISAATCPETPGASALFSHPDVNIVWVGEVHGTEEHPALFGDLVCTAVQTGRPVVVALERAVAEQAVWDTFLTSDGSAEAEEGLLSGVEWRQPFQDGRHSRAILALAHRLRDMKAAGRSITVRLILRDTPADLPADGYEAQMADAVMEAERQAPNAITLVYTGNLHARKTRITSFGEPYRPAAAQVPANAVLSAIIKSGPGTGWNCQADGCGPHPYKPRGYAEHPRSVVMEASQEGFDAVAYTGTVTTASPPAVGPPAPTLVPKAMLPPHPGGAPGAVGPHS